MSTRKFNANNLNRVTEKVTESSFYGLMNTEKVKSGVKKGLTVMAILVSVVLIILGILNAQYHFTGKYPQFLTNYYEVFKSYIPSWEYIKEVLWAQTTLKTGFALGLIGAVVFASYLAFFTSTHETTVKRVFD